MKKVYQQPEFVVIQQNQANAKFFVASGEPENPTPNPNGGTDGDPITSYGRDADGFTF